MTFEKNFIGLHLHANLEVTESRFIDNPYCGVKAEPGIEPVMRDNSFRGSKFNYHKPENPKQTIEELNEEPANSGNREE